MRGTCCANSVPKSGLEMSVVRLRFSAKKENDGLLADNSQQARGGDSKKVSNACYLPLQPNEK